MTTAEHDQDYDQEAEELELAKAMLRRTGSRSLERTDKPQVMARSSRSSTFAGAP